MVGLLSQWVGTVCGGSRYWARSGSGAVRRGVREHHAFVNFGRTVLRKVTERPTLHQSHSPDPSTTRAFHLYETSARTGSAQAQYLRRHENALCPRRITRAGEQDVSDPGPTNNGAP